MIDGNVHLETSLLSARPFAIKSSNAFISTSTFWNIHWVWWMQFETFWQDMFVKINIVYNMRTLIYICMYVYIYIYELNWKPIVYFNCHWLNLYEDWYWSYFGHTAEDIIATNISFTYRIIRIFCAWRLTRTRILFPINALPGSAHPVRCYDNLK